MLLMASWAADEPKWRGGTYFSDEDDEKRTELSPRWLANEKEKDCLFFLFIKTFTCILTALWSRIRSMSCMK